MTTKKVKTQRVRRTGRGPVVSPDLILNGRKLAVQEIDNMMAMPENLKKLREAMQDAFDNAPLLFFQDFLRPLLPKQMILGTQTDGKATLSIVVSHEGIGDNDA